MDAGYFSEGHLDIVFSVGDLIVWCAVVGVGHAAKIGREDSARKQDRRLRNPSDPARVR